MKTKLIFILLFTSLKAISCDICGCFMGITPYDNQSSLGIHYRYRSYHGYVGQNQQFLPKGSSYFPTANQKINDQADHGNDLNDYEIYRTAELRGRYFAQKNIEFNIIVPYLNNSERYNNQTSTISGLGDISLYAGYHLIRKLDQKKINQRLITGIGIKLASGKHDIQSENGILYNFPFQPGTGSTDGFIYANYILGYKKWGFSLNSSFKVNGENANQKSLANSTTNFINIFKTLYLKNEIKIIPSIQASYEFAKGEKYKGKLTGEHETNNLMTGLGIDIFVKNIAINASTQINTWSAVTDHPRNSGRINLGITYNLKQMYYAIN